MAAWRWCATRNRSSQTTYRTLPGGCQHAFSPTVAAVGWPRPGPWMVGIQIIHGPGVGSAGQRQSWLGCGFSTDERGFPSWKLVGERTRQVGTGAQPCSNRPPDHSIVSRSREEPGDNHCCTLSSTPRLLPTGSLQWQSAAVSRPLAERVREKGRQPPSSAGRCVGLVRGWDDWPSTPAGRDRSGLRLASVR